MAYGDLTRIAVLEGLVKELSEKLSALCEDHARIAGTTPDKVLSLKAHRELIARAEAYFASPRPASSPPLARPGYPRSPLGIQSPAGPHTTP
jgi:hypothetical protein